MKLTEECLAKYCNKPTNQGYVFCYSDAAITKLIKCKKVCLYVCVCVHARTCVYIHACVFITCLPMLPTSLNMIILNSTG